MVKYKPSTKIFNGSTNSSQGKIKMLLCSYLRCYLSAPGASHLPIISARFRIDWYALRRDARKFLSRWCAGAACLDLARPSYIPTRVPEPNPRARPRKFPLKFWERSIAARGQILRSRASVVYLGKRIDDLATVYFWNWWYISEGLCTLRFCWLKLKLDID